MLTRRDLMLGMAAPLKLPRKLRLAVIGTVGHIGDVLAPLPQLPEVELVAVAETDPDGLKTVAGRPLLKNAKLYADYRKMLDEVRPDVVAICNDNGARAKAVIECAERKLPMMAEKPLAIDRKEYERARRAIERSGQPVQLILPLRYESHFKALKEIVASGVIGEVGQISSQKSYKAGNRAQWYRERASYGSTILWIGIHMFDLMRWCSGREFREAFSYQGQVGAGPNIGQMENTTTTVLRMDNGGSASLHMDYYRTEQAATHGDDRLRIAGSKGVVEYMASTGVTLLEQGKKPVVVSPLPAAGQIFVDYLGWAFAGQPCSMPLTDIWRVNEITLAAHESAVQGRAVKI
jgi:predicted dehydrogenase